VREDEALQIERRESVSSLSGDRIALRPIERTDLPRLCELLEDLEVAALADGGPIVLASLAQWEARFEQQAANPSKDEVSFAVEVEGQVIGQAGLHRIDHFNQRCELGIALGKEYWGKGLGQEAVGMLVDYAFTYLNMNRVSLRVLADDARAIGAYLKAGFCEEGRLRQAAWVAGRFEDELVMSVLQEERSRADAIGRSGAPERPRTS
jgi:diamine N-acetyltransferase